MSRRILIQVTAPAVIIGFVLFLTCLFSAWYVDWMQSNLNTILVANVSSMEAGQQLENRVRKLRFDCFLYLIDPSPELWADIQNDESQFEEWLGKAQESSSTPREYACIQVIRVGYQLYRKEFERLSDEVKQHGVMAGSRQLANSHPVLHVVDPCREYARINEEMMLEAADQSKEVTQRLHLTMLLVGLGGPLAGLVGGYGIARGLSQSLYRLSVRVQDAAQQLERPGEPSGGHFLDVGMVNLSSDGDMEQINRQLERVVKRVSEVAEQVQKQQQEMLRAQQLAAVGQLAASVAHEVRNPLTAIKLLVEVALRTERPRPLTQENLKVVHGEVLRLEQTVQTFLDFARPPALQRQHCDIRDLVGRAVSLVQARARQQQATLDVRWPESPASWWPTVEVDPNQFRTVLVNLLLNALDAMPTGGRLTIDLEAGPKELQCRVEDTGTGISPEVAERLFTPFTSTKETGSGLGLSICRRIVEEHGGRITACNREGGGSCFTFRLPAQPPSSSSPRAAGFTPAERPPG